MDKESIQKRLNEVAIELQAIGRMLTEDAGVFPPEKLAVVNNGMCLNCGLPLTSKQTRTIRGCHESCYREIMREIESGTITENEAIAQGLLLPPTGGGRPVKQTKLKEIVAAKRLQNAEEDVGKAEQLIAERRKKKQPKKDGSNGT